MDGEVINVWTDADGGKSVRVRYKDGSIHGFAHLSEQDVKKGDTFSAGEALAKSGNTGRSTGPHLHWTVTVGGEKVDPNKWAAGRANSGTRAQAVDATSLESVIASAERAAAANGVDLTPSLRDKIRREAATRWQIHEASVKDREDNVFESVLASLEKNGGDWNAIPAGMKAAMSPRDRISAMGVADGIRSRGDTHSETAWVDFVTKTPAEIAALNPADYARAYQGKFDKEHFERGGAMIAAARGGAYKNIGKVEADGILSVSARVKTSAIGLGILPASGSATDSAAKAYATFEADIDARVRDFERTHLQGKRKASGDEIQTIIDQASQDKVFISEWGTDPEKPLGSLSQDQIKNAYVKVGETEVKISKIPANDRVLIIDALRKAGRAVTERAIAELYLKRNK